jgi:hypothetical protein
VERRVRDGNPSAPPSCACRTVSRSLNPQCLISASLIRPFFLLLYPYLFTSSLRTGLGAPLNVLPSSLLFYATRKLHNAFHFSDFVSALACNLLKGTGMYMKTGKLQDSLFNSSSSSLQVAANEAITAPPSLIESKAYRQSRRHRNCVTCDGFRSHPPLGRTSMLHRRPGSKKLRYTKYGHQA